MEAKKESKWGQVVLKQCGLWGDLIITTRNWITKWKDLRRARKGKDWNEIKQNKKQCKKERKNSNYLQIKTTPGNNGNKEILVREKGQLV